MANLLEDYIAKLTANTQPYTPLTDAEIEEKAKNKYKTIYDQNRLSAQQQYDTALLARQQSLENLNENYDLQKEQSRKNYADLQATALRNALSRGMQRSSYLGATVGNIGVKGAEAQQAIEKNREGSIKNYNEQNTLAAQQLAAQMAQYDKGQLADQLAYQDELEQREYERGQTSADRQNQLASDIYNAQLTAAQNDWWGMSDLLGIPSSGGSSHSGSSSSKKSSSGSSNKNNSSSSSSAYDKLLASSGSSSKPSLSAGSGYVTKYAQNLIASKGDSFKKK